MRLRSDRQARAVMTTPSGRLTGRRHGRRPALADSSSPRLPGVRLAARYSSPPSAFCRSISAVVLALPARIASANCCTISSIERMLSSLPGIGRSTSSGSQSVSISATVVMPSLRASRIAFFSFCGIDDHQALGQAVHRAHAVEVAVHLAVLAVSAPTASSSSRSPSSSPARKRFELLQAGRAGCESCGSWSACRPASGR